MYKRFIMMFLVICAVVLTAFGGVVYAVDPLTLYRAPADFTQVIYQVPDCQNTGIARYCDYDTVITGTSMTENFRATWFDEAGLSKKAVRLCYGGGSIEDFDVFLGTALESRGIKTIYFGLDNYLLAPDGKQKEKTLRIPPSLIDGKAITDVNYLLNRYVLFNDVKNWFSYRYSGTYNFYDMHSWGPYFTFSRQTVLDGYSRPTSQPVKPDDYFMPTAEHHLGLLFAYIDSHPETEFVFFAPPYSILYWDTQQQNGTGSAMLGTLEYAYRELIKRENVRAFYFQNEKDIILDLNKYKDTTHYSQEINRFMLDCFVSGRCELTKENINTVFAGMRETVSGFDYEEFMRDNP